MAAIEARKEIKWMRNILTEFGYPLFCISTLSIDNKSRIKVIKNLEYHGYMKHLDLQYY